MNLIDIILLGAALSMDAAAVSMTIGMTNPNVKRRRLLFPALMFGLFQAIMPLIGYYITELVSGAFTELFEKVAAWVAFAILAAIGGKMIYDGVKEGKAAKDETAATETKSEATKNLSVGGTLIQAVATSIDALAVGISLKMAAIEGSLFPAIGWTVAIIGAITFLLSAAATGIGKKAGDKLSDKAEILGGAVLVLIALKTLISSFL